jgi:hypothetical protein
MNPISLFSLFGIVRGTPPRGLVNAIGVWGERNLAALACREFHPTFIKGTNF